LRYRNINNHMSPVKEFDFLAWSILNAIAYAIHNDVLHIRYADTSLCIAQRQLQRCKQITLSYQIVTGVIDVSQSSIWDRTVRPGINIALKGPVVQGHSYAVWASAEQLCVWYHRFPGTVFLTNLLKHKTKAVPTPYKYLIDASVYARNFALREPPLLSRGNIYRLIYLGKIWS